MVSVDLRIFDVLDPMGRTSQSCHKSDIPYFAEFSLSFWILSVQSATFTPGKEMVDELIRTDLA